MKRTALKRRSRHAQCLGVGFRVLGFRGLIRVFGFCALGFRVFVLGFRAWRFCGFGVWGSVIQGLV